LPIRRSSTTVSFRLAQLAQARGKGLAGSHSWQHTTSVCIASRRRCSCGPAQRLLERETETNSGQRRIDEKKYIASRRK
jgi:hypothetical protein